MSSQRSVAEDIAAIIGRIYAEPTRIAKNASELNAVLLALHRWLAELTNDDGAIASHYFSVGNGDAWITESSIDEIVEQWRANDSAGGIVI